MALSHIVQNFTTSAIRSLEIHSLRKVNFCFQLKFLLFDLCLYLEFICFLNFLDISILFYLFFSTGGLVISLRHSAQDASHKEVCK